MLRLPENPTTGYRWELSVSAGLSVVDDTYVSSDTSGRLMGAGGNRVWKIAVSGKGTRSVRAVYRRSWEPVTGNEKVYLLTVTAR